MYVFFIEYAYMYERMFNSLTVCLWLKNDDDYMMCTGVEYIFYILYDMVSTSYVPYLYVHMRIYSYTRDIIITKSKSC